MKEFDLLMLVTEHVTSFSREDLAAKGRSRILVEIRIACTNILRKFDKDIYTVNVIGDLFNIDHSTISYYCKQHPNLIQQSSLNYKGLYNKLKIAFQEKMDTFTSTEVNNLLEKKQQLEKELKEIDSLLALKNKKQKV
jgi:hypothetical protein